MAPQVTEQVMDEVKSGMHLSLIVLLGVVVGYWIVSTIVSYRRLSHIKGPPLAAVTQLWYMKSMLSGQSAVDLSEVCDKYGSLTRIGPNLLLTCDHDLYRRTNSLRSDYTRSRWYKAARFDADHENLVSEIDEEKHTKMRAKVAPGYIGKENTDLEGDIDRVVESLLDLIRRKYVSVGSTTKPMDFATMMNFFTLDVISSLSLGESFGFVAEDTDKFEYLKTMEKNFPVMMFFSAVPLLTWMMSQPWFLRFAQPKVTDNVGMGRIKRVTRELIAKRFGPNAEKHARTDMTQSFIEHGLSEQEIADESMLQILAGSDTAATAFRVCMAAILGNPRVYQKLQAECDGSGVPATEIISNAQARELPYLQACIREALRYHPPASGILPRVVGPKGDTWNGVYLPPGTEIGFCAWNLHRKHKEIYGEDAELYRPERWTEATPDHRARLVAEQELVFGYGRYRCLGEQIAKAELNKAIFELIRRYDWALVNPLRPFEKNVNYGLWMQKGLWVRITERNA